MKRKLQAEGSRMASDEFTGPLEMRRAHLAKVRTGLRTIQQRRASLARSVEDYRSYDVGADQRLIKNLEARRSTVMDAIALHEATIEGLKDRLQANQDQLVSPLHIRRYFSGEQKQLRMEGRNLRGQISTTQERITIGKAKLARVHETIISARARLSDHEAFDVGEARRQLAEAESEAQELTRVEASLAGEIQRMEAHVGAHLSEYRRLTAELAAVNADIHVANRFEERLRDAGDGAQRARVHQECEAKFGTGSPRQVIQAKSGRKRYLDNNVPKVGRRLLSELKKFERRVEHLIIDGNNLCYQGETFIGLGALQALLDQVQDRFKVTIVFDASIRRLLKSDDQGIALRLGARGTPHVSPTRTSADEYLMRLAGEDPTAFILSNDRFAEFHDYDVVRSDRVLRFMIADGRLMVNSLDVTAELHLAPGTGG